MTRGRLEAFSDGVVAILITIMVLQLKLPHGAELAALRPLLPVFLSYVLSFIFVGIYWSNHHHLLHTVDRVNGPILWANLHLLFWLSLVPFTTGWMGQHRFAPLPTALYGVVLLCCALAYTILTVAIVKHQGAYSKLASAVGRDRNVKLSLLLYTIAIPMAFLNEWVAYGIYIAVALIWLVPDRRIERHVAR